MPPEETLLQCDICEKKFGTRSSLRVHKKIHNRQENRQSDFNCETCDRSFNSKQGKAVHIKKIHSNDFSQGLKKRKVAIDGKSSKQLPTNSENSNNKSTKSPPMKKIKGEYSNDNVVENIVEEIFEEAVKVVLNNAIQPDESKLMNKAIIDPDIEFLTATNEDLSSALDSVPKSILTEANEDEEDHRKSSDNNDAAGNLETIQKQLENTEDINEEENIFLETIEPRIIEKTLKTLKENENQILREKMLNMEKKLFDQEKVIIHLSENLTEVKDKYKAEIDKNIKIEKALLSTTDLNRVKDKHIEKLEDDINKKNEAICRKCVNKDNVDSTDTGKTITHEKEGSDISERKKSSNKPEETLEILNTDDANGGVIEMDVDDLDARQIINNKKRGFKRSSPQIEPEKMKPHINCDKCASKFYSGYDLQNHMNTVHIEDGDWTCDQCDFQTNDNSKLRNHFNNTGHKLECKFCDISFQSSDALKKHKKDSHLSYKPCKNYPENKCEYDMDCKFLHYVSSENEHICFKCGDIFGSKTALLSHVRSNHGDTPCLKFKQKKCPYLNGTCFFAHVMNNDASGEERVRRNSGFQYPPQNLAPPDLVSSEQENLENPLNNQGEEIMKKVMEMMENLTKEVMILKQKVQ